MEIFHYICEPKLYPRIFINNLTIIITCKAKEN